MLLVEIAQGTCRAEVKLGRLIGSSMARTLRMDAQKRWEENNNGEDFDHYFDTYVQSGAWRNDIAQPVEQENEEADPYALGMGHFKREWDKEDHPVNPHPSTSPEHHQWNSAYEMGKRDRYKELGEGETITKPNEFDKKAKKMTYPNVYKDRGRIGAKKKLSAQTVVVKSSGNGTVYGRRTIFQK